MRFPRFPGRRGFNFPRGVLGGLGREGQGSAGPPAPGLCSSLRGLCHHHQPTFPGGLGDLEAPKGQREPSKGCFEHPPSIHPRDRAAVIREAGKAGIEDVRGERCAWVVQVEALGLVVSLRLARNLPAVTAERGHSQCEAGAWAG